MSKETSSDIEEIQQLITALTQSEQTAINMVKVVLDIYNSFDGNGHFKGISRYMMLEGRLKIAAVQSTTLLGFWGCLRKKMLWNIPPKKADLLIVKIWKQGNQHKVLKILAENSAEIIMLARLLHDADKDAAKVIQKEQSEIDSSFNDTLEF